ncbi:MAG: hypothetical protein K2M07_03860 [Muribaculaceae bacterium]|nr:hypothetical protein [Muribaculaceae bacterium]
MWILLTILFIIGVAIVWPVLKIALKIHSQYRQFSRMMNGEMPGSRREGSRKKSKGSPPAPPKKKKIDGSVGEYVEFEEIRVEASERTYGDTTTIKFKVEQQITDVEFEDLP